MQINRSATSKAKELDTCREQALSRLECGTGRARSTVLSGADQQETVYRMKRREAERYLSLDPEPADLAGFPMLRAEVGVTSDTPHELATLWLAKDAGEAPQVIADVEGIKMGAKKAILAAQTKADIEEAARAAIEQLVAISGCGTMPN